MKPHQTLAFATFVTLLSMSCGHIGGGAPLQDVNPQFYCGRSLARALALLCFDEGGYDKRSELGPMYGMLKLLSSKLCFSLSYCSGSGFKGSNRLLLSFLFNNDAREIFYPIFILKIMYVRRKATCLS